MRRADSGRFAASLLEGLISNNKLIDSFSVAYTREYSVLPPARMELYQERVRCIRDRDRGRVLLGRSLIIDAMDEKSEIQSRNYTYVVQFGGEGRGVLIDGVGKRELRIPPQVPASRAIAMPSFHSVGMIAFPDGGTLFGPDHAIWLEQSIEQEMLTSKLIDNRHASVTHVYEQDGTETVTHSWIFDLESLCPTQHRGFYFDSSSQRRVLKEEERYRWENIGGVNVPVSIWHEDRQKGRTPDTKEPFDYQETTDTKLHWESVGGELEEAATSLEQFDTVDSVTTWIQEGFPVDQE